MKMFDRIANWLITTAMKTPYSHINDYMMRYWLIPFKGESSSPSATQYPGQFPILTRLLSLFGIAARVHHILRSDDDRAFHDHPWNFVSVVLRGGYWEYRPIYDESGLYLYDEIEWFGPGSVIRRKAGDKHRLVLPHGETAHTLFITTKWRQNWGFFPINEVKIFHKDYDQYCAEQERKAHQDRVARVAFAKWSHSTNFDPTTITMADGEQIILDTIRRGRKVNDTSPL